MSESSWDFLGKCATHIWSMHRWQRGLFTVALAMLLGGSASQLTAPAAPAVATPSAPEMPAPQVRPPSPALRAAPGSPAANQAQRDSQLNRQPAPEQSAPPPSAAEPQPTSRQHLSSTATRIGASIVGGFLIGFGLRVFLRITAMLIALGALILMGLSYFNIMNVDLTAAKTKYESSIHWVEDQAYRLKDAAQSHLPSSGGGLVGVFAGFKRRRVSS